MLLKYFLFVCLFIYFETGFYVIHACLEFLICLPLPPNDGIAGVYIFGGVGGFETGFLCISSAALEFTL